MGKDSTMLVLLLAMASPVARADILEIQRRLSQRREPPPIDLVNGHESRSATGTHFAVEYTPDTPDRKIPVSKIHSWTIKLTTPAGQPVPGAQLTVTGIMPQHEHGMQTEAEVHESEPGTYVATGLKFHMPGWWIVTVGVASGAESEALNLPIMVRAEATSGSPVWSAREAETIREMWLGRLPPLRKVAFPTNAFTLNPAARTFGRRLFFDRSLSKGGAISCGTCHLSERAFAGDKPLLVPGQGLRKVPTLAGVAWQSWFDWDGRKDSLWSQALAPIESPTEYHLDRAQWVARVLRKYPKTYGSIFGPPPAELTAADITQVFVNTGKAIAAFEATISPQPSPFDRYAERTFKLPATKGPPGSSAGERPEPPFSQQQVEGLRLFIGKARCVECHHGPRLEDDAFHNIGIPIASDEDVLGGRYVSIPVVEGDPFNCRGRFGLAYGRSATGKCGELDHLPQGQIALGGAFKTPTLRHVALTAPYMHGGQYATLAEVVHHYDIAPEAKLGETELLPLGLSAAEEADLVAFLAGL